MINIHALIAIPLNIFLFSAIIPKTNLKFEKSFSLVCRACWEKSIDIAITHWNLINIHASLFVWKFYGFWKKNSKMNSKLEKCFPLVCRPCWDKSIDVSHQIFRIKMKSSYLFEDRGTDRQTESISEVSYSLKDLSNDTWQAYQSWKLISDEENNIPLPSPLH